MSSTTVLNRQRVGAVDAARCRRLVVRLLEGLGATDARLSVVLVDDAAIAVLNRRYHGTDGATDVLAFEYGPGETTGEIIVSVEHALAAARRLRVAPSRELALYLVHGVLHLQGHDDRTAAARRVMRAAERRWLARLARSPGWAGLLQPPRGRDRRPAAGAARDRGPGGRRSR